MNHYKITILLKLLVRLNMLKKYSFATIMFCIFTHAAYANLNDPAPLDYFYSQAKQYAIYAAIILLAIGVCMLAWKVVRISIKVILTLIIIGIGVYFTNKIYNYSSLPQSLAILPSIQLSVG